MTYATFFRSFLSLRGIIGSALVITFLLTAPTAVAHLIHIGGEQVREVFFR